MPVSYEDKIKEQARPYLEAGEHVLAAFMARPRGATTAGAAGLGPGAIGGMKTARHKRAAGQAGLQLANPMALALTGSRLLVLSISPPVAMGKGGDVKELISAAPLADVESIEVKRLLVGKTVTVTVCGVSFKLEAGPARMPRAVRRVRAREENRLTRDWQADADDGRSVRRLAGA